jgi:hypothetical protein
MPFSNCADGVSERTCPELVEAAGPELAEGACAAPVEGNAEKFAAAASATIAIHCPRIACSFRDKPGHPIHDRV